jgi:hypothetical protein
MISAGYFWASANINAIVDNLDSGNPADVCRVTDVVNRWEGEEARRNRRNYYAETIDVIR